jgi:hypothetical protein
MTDWAGTTDADSTTASLGRLVPFLGHLQERRGPRSEWRKLERQWLAMLLDKPVIPFSDVQIAAELLARHHWEDVRRDEEAGSPRCVEAMQRLHEIRARRHFVASIETRSAPPPAVAPAIPKGGRKKKP